MASDGFGSLHGRLLLFPPSATYNVYPYPATHPMNAFAMIDVEKPDVQRFPACSNLPRPTIGPSTDLP